MGDTGIELPPPAPTPWLNRNAIGSLIFGVLGIFPVFLVGSIVAIVLGRMARTEISRAGGRQTGLGMAKAGRVLGWIGVGMCVVLILLWAAVVWGCQRAGSGCGM